MIMKCNCAWMRTVSSKNFQSNFDAYLPTVAVIEKDSALEVIIQSEIYLGAMMDAETGQRGFLLTRDTSYLEPYHNGIINAHTSFRELKRLTSDNPAQRERLQKIEKNMLLKFDELNETIQLMQVGNDSASKALEIVKNDSGKHYMDRIRVDISSFITEEKITALGARGREFGTITTTAAAVVVIMF